MGDSPLTGSLRSPPLPAKQGRGNAGRGLAPFLAPMKWGRGGERSEPVRGKRIRLKTQMRLP